MVLCFLYLIASGFCKPSLYILHGPDSLANIEQDKHEIACLLGNKRATAMKRTFVVVALHSFPLLMYARKTCPKILSDLRSTVKLL